MQLPHAPRPLFKTIWGWLDMARALDFQDDAAKAAAYAQVAAWGAGWAVVCWRWGTPQWRRRGGTLPTGAELTNPCPPRSTLRP